MGKRGKSRHSVLRVISPKAEIRVCWSSAILARRMRIKKQSKIDMLVRIAAIDGELKPGDPVILGNLRSHKWPAV